MFGLFLAVENELTRHFESPSGYMRDSFELVIDKIASLGNLPTIACTLHREKLIPLLVYHYIVIRYRFEAKQKKITDLSEAKAARHSKRKLGKLTVSENKKKRMDVNNNNNKVA
jgi:hypothetical protein